MAGRKVTRNRQCLQCGVSPITGTKFCSSSCCTEHRSQLLGRRPREVVNAERRAAAMLTCRVCGARYLRQTGGKGYCCSRKCGDTLLRWRGEQTRATTKAKREFAKWARPIRTCAGCGSTIQLGLRCTACARAHSEAYQLARSIAQHDDSPRECKECGAEFSPVYGEKRKTYCSAECSKRHNQRTARLKGKAKKRAATVEPVNPMRVFVRDGWLCHLCGGRTDKAKRGSLHPNAPELDHIVPLSKGGEHSYANTACAHKRCNAAKSDRIIGQPSLLVA